MDTVAFFSITIIISALLVALDIYGRETKYRDLWRRFLGYLVTVCIIYYFFWIRVPSLLAINEWNASDLVLGILLLFGIFGWLPDVVKNVSNGVSKIFTKGAEWLSS